MDNHDFMVAAADIADIAAEFHDRVARMVCCNMATVDERDRPRSRIVHPIWDGPIGWIGTWRTSVRSGHCAPAVKVRQLAHNPFVSLAYIGELAKPVYVDGRAEVVDDLAPRRRFWELAKSSPPPYGYDPAETFSTPDGALGTPDDPRFAVLRVEPSRIVLVDFPAPPGQVIVWRA